MMGYKHQYERIMSAVNHLFYPPTSTLKIFLKEETYRGLQKEYHDSTEYDSDTVINSIATTSGTYDIIVSDNTFTVERVEVSTEDDRQFKVYLS